MKRIMAIYGHAGCGKTETLNNLKKLIIENGGTNISDNLSFEGDKQDAFNYKGQIICVCPGGDTGNILKENFEYAIKKNADIIITASRTKGASVNVVYDYEKELSVKTEWFKKCLEYLLSEEIQHACNEEYAKIVFAKI